ncbi:DUF1648 domain-containing protein [Streptomyces sp. NBC_01754]|uniref:DUF1648 domain-containing protein n=1 Tax=Streptomyces sp. NBC_01754 TaxID=2975930 RepID=UPI002DD7B8EA|nr:DUF1648 domain-containing protein [Streptomyces sp. NBC_01754]WSC94769.1 DUF1648 domain-containing protein [Streptomyces sp. NBC_01754]
MNRTKTGRAILAALPFLLALILALVLAATLGDRLPARMATHFSVNGEADGYTSRTTFLVITALVPLLSGACWSFMVGRGRFHGGAYDGFTSAGYATAAFFGYMTTATLLTNVDAAGGEPGASFTMWHLAGAFGAAAVAAGLGFCVARLLPAPPDTSQTAGGARSGARIPLADGEVAGWARGMTSWWLPASALVTALAGAVLAFAAGPGAGLPLVVLGLIILPFSRPNVTVDRRGLTVSGLLPWPRVHVPLERIDTAASEDVNAMADYGGWGYRVLPARSGVITRSGEAIVARLENGRDFAVTVDDSATAAALLNTLVDRRRGRA